ncbi:hypothetical protein AAVH_41576 [Aphelenchoides avenae]|nr:hypothetical protein AAVH_41576 [Aphelenchus avenae]
MRIASSLIWLIVREPKAFTFPVVLHEATGRHKRFRCHLQGEDTAVRASIYENPARRKYLIVVTFDHFCRTVLFHKGNAWPIELKQIFERKKRVRLTSSVTGQASIAY